MAIIYVIVIIYPYVITNFATINLNNQDMVYMPTVKSHLHGQTDPASRLN